MTIVLIDDSASVREVLRLALESEGYRVIEAADDRKCVAAFREHHPAVTIVDIVMPEKDGIETVREILAIDPAAVIFTMSGADDDYQEVARMLGARRGFRKPVVIEEVLVVFKELFRASGA
jgi:two-component system, chemotaxis family, chemotaxis protein CheY